MNDQETYAYWARTCAQLDSRYLCGEITGDESDLIIANMEERLGMNKWTLDRWQEANEAWLASEEGA